VATLDVLEGVRDVAALTVGVVSSYRGIPRLAPDDAKLPAAITRWNVEEVGFTEIGALEQWAWPVRIDLLYARGNDIWAVEASLLPFAEAMVAAIRARQTFNGAGVLVNPILWRPILLGLWDETYVALSFTFVVENQFERGGSVAP
jgi:hypothetical protein